VATTTAAAARPAAPAPEHRLACGPDNGFGRRPGHGLYASTVIERPRIKAHLDVVSVDGDKLFLLDAGKHFLLEGRVAARLGPLLDGTRELADLIAEAGDELPLTEVLRTLGTLEALGYLADGPSEGDRGAVAYWDAAGVAPGTGASALSLPVELLAAGAVPLAAIEAALGSSGLHLGDGGLALVVTEDYLHDDLAEINRRLHAEGRPWVLAKPAGTQAWLGPFVRPGETACWACLAQRLAGNRQLERYLAGKNGRAVVIPSAGAALTSTLQATVGLLATEIAGILATGRSPRLENTLVTLELSTLASEQHHVARQPHCEVCGDPTLPQRRLVRVELNPVPKQFTSDGGHRIQRPEQTYERLAKHVSPLTGAVSSLKRQTMDDNGVAYSYSSGHNFALMQDSLYFLRRNLRGRSGGKGRTEVQAKVGAICEAIERFNGVFRGDERRERASFAELGERAVHIEDLLLFSDTQYAERAKWNAAQVAGYHLVPDRLEADRQIDWTPCWSLTHERERLVPSAYCYFGHPDMNDRFFCASDANGNAAGNTLEEAALQGLMELVERDSVALWWYNRAPRPALDLDSLGEPYVDVMREHYDGLDRELWVLDLTSDLGIPVFSACSFRRNGPTQDILMGFGAHLDPRTAALRALTELNQFLPAVCELNPDGTTNYWMDDPDAIAWWRTATLESDPYVLPAPSLPATCLGDFEMLASDDLSEDVRRAAARIADAGHEVILLDQTRPDIELSVVKVMAPGLRHFWRRLGPGRLYDVPPRLGWLDAPIAEDRLNPTSIFF
jgi:oxazoline/thiazoline synthase